MKQKKRQKPLPYQPREETAPARPTVTIKARVTPPASVGPTGKRRRRGRSRAVAAAAVPHGRPPPSWGGRASVAGATCSAQRPWWPRRRRRWRVWGRRPQRPAGPQASSPLPGPCRRWACRPQAADPHRRQTCCGCPAWRGGWWQLGTTSSGRYRPALGRRWRRRVGAPPPPLFVWSSPHDQLCFCGRFGLVVCQSGNAAGAPCAASVSRRCDCSPSVQAPAPSPTKGRCPACATRTRWQRCTTAADQGGGPIRGGGRAAGVGRRGRCAAVGNGSGGPTPSRSPSGRGGRWRERGAASF